MKIHQFPGTFLAALIAFGSFLNAHSQLVTSRTKIKINTGGVFFVGGSFTNADSLVNQGNLVSGGDFINSASPGAVLYNSGRVEARTGFNVSAGVYSQIDAGTVALTSNMPGNLDMGTHNLYNLEINAGLTTTKTLTSNCTIRNDLSLLSGILATGANTLYLDSSSSLTKADITSTNSYISGSLTRRKQNSFDFLAFPVAQGATYRPVVMTDLGSIAGPQPVYTVSVSTAANGGSPGDGLISVFQLPTWTVSRQTPAHHDYSVRLYFTRAELGANPSLDTIFTAQSGSINGTYTSKGQRNLNPAVPASLSNITSRYVLDDAATTYFALGVNRNIQAKAAAWLSGAFSSGSMAPMPVAILDSMFGPGAGVAPVKMRSGYSVPPGAVDQITLRLRQGAVYADSAYAWLLENGTIVDFETGENEYVTFARALPNVYYRMVISHRNHLSIMSSDSISFVSNTDQAFDLKDIAGIYGGGATPLGGTNYGMYLGNARNNNQEVNASDLADVIMDRNTITVTGYVSTDVDMNGQVDSDDVNMTSEANTNLYFSTVP